MDKRLLGLACGCVFLIGLRLTSADGGNSARVSGHVTLDTLPPTLERRPTQGLDDDGLRTLLLQQPSIVLDAATLEIAAPKAGSSRSLMVDRLELKGGSTIVTNGVNLEIYANQIISERGQIVAFTRDSEKRLPTPDGQNGATGLSAGTVVLAGELANDGVLGIHLDGQPGQPGGKGVKGPNGPRGARGQDGADHLLDCAHGGGDGNKGGQGGKGGPGGNGGSGGAGGNLVLRGKIASQRQLIDFSALGGAGGAVGSGGLGGDGGLGGEGGSGSTYCRGGHGGQPGEPGPIGDTGAPGSPGQAGGIAAD